MSSSGTQKTGSAHSPATATAERHHAPGRRRRRGRCRAGARSSSRSSGPNGQPVRARAVAAREDRVAQRGEDQQQREHERVRTGPAPSQLLQLARVVERLEAGGGEADGRGPGGPRWSRPGAAAARHMRHGAHQGRRDDDGDHLERPVCVGRPPASPEQGVRQRPGRAQRRGLALPPAAPRSRRQLADSDQQSEGEREPGSVEPVPQGGTERGDGERRGAATPRRPGASYGRHGCRRAGRGCDRMPARPVPPWTPAPPRPRRAGAVPLAGAGTSGTSAVTAAAPAVAVEARARAAHHPRVELASGAPPQLVDGRGDGPCPPVGLRVEVIASKASATATTRANSGICVAGEAVRISAAVDAARGGAGSPRAPRPGSRCPARSRARTRGAVR